MNVIIIVDNKPTEVSDDACKSEGKTYAERFGTPSHPNGCPTLIAVALEKAEAENAALRSALKPFSEYARFNSEPVNYGAYGPKIKLTDWLAAREAMGKETKP